MDFKTNHFLLTFEINENELVKGEYDRLKNYEKLKIKATRYTRKRSLDANAYFHVLVGKIAEALTISKAKAKKCSDLQIWTTSVITGWLNYGL